MKALLNYFWSHWVQTTCGFLVFVLTTVDWAGMSGPCKAVFGEPWGTRVYYATIALAGLATMARGYQAKLKAAQVDPATIKSIVLLMIGFGLVLIAHSPI